MDTEDYCINNLDKFYEGLYNYYLGRGYYPILMNNLTKWLNSGIIIFFFLMVTLGINWSLLNPPVNFSNTNTPWVCFISLECIALLVHWLYSACIRVQDIRYIGKISYFYRTILIISDDDIPFLKWSQIVDKLIYLKENNKLPFIRKEINDLDIRKRITRKSNYMLFLSETLLKNHYISKLLSDNISSIIINQLFTQELLINNVYLENIFKYYTLFMVLVNIISIPFRIVYVIVIFFLQNAEVIYTEKNIVFNRLWIDYKFKLYNELPHTFQYRMRKSSIVMNKWINRNQNYVLLYIISLFVSICSNLVAISIPLLVLNSEMIFLNNKIIWYVACLTTLIIVCRKQFSIHSYKLTNDESKNKLIEYTYSHELSNVELLTVYRYFKEVYIFHFDVFLRDICSIFQTPLILYKLSKLNIYNIITDNTVIDNNCGEICKFSYFENIDTLAFVEQNMDKKN